MKPPQSTLYLHAGDVKKVYEVAYGITLGIYDASKKAYKVRVLLFLECMRPHTKIRPLHSASPTTHLVVHRDLS